MDIEETARTGTIGGGDTRSSHERQNFWENSTSLGRSTHLPVRRFFFFICIVLSFVIKETHDFKEWFASLSEIKRTLMDEFPAQFLHQWTSLTLVNNPPSSGLYMYVSS